MSDLDGASSSISSTFHNLSPRAWAGIVIGGVAIGLYLRKRNAASATTSTATTDTAAGDSGVGTLGGASDTTSTSAGTSATTSAMDFSAPILTNDDWRKAAENWLLAQNDNPSLVDSAIAHYLTGQPLSVNESAVIDAAIRYVGATPYIVPAPTVQTPAAPSVDTSKVDTTTTTTNQAPTPTTTVQTPASSAPVPAPAPAPAAAVSPAPGTAVQVANPVPGDNSAVVVGTTSDGNSFTYGGSQAQANLLTGGNAPASYDPHGSPIIDGVGRQYIDSNGFTYWAG